MGICVSSASSEIHQADDGLENVTHVQENTVSHGIEKLSSLYSREGSKGVNQDAAIVHLGYGVEHGAFCGVFDGHGKNGHVVSRTVRNRLPSLLLNQKNALEEIDSVRDHGSEKADGGLVPLPGESFHKWKDACVGAFKVMDKEIKLQESLDCSCSGTTAVVVVRQGEDLVIANLGDSRAVLGRTNDQKGIMPVQLTTDLKPGVPSEAKRIRKCNGRVLALKEEPHVNRVWLPHEDSPGLAMSRAFGDFLLKKHGIIALPDISYHRVTSEDQFVVLASDGVWDVLSNKEVVSIVSAADCEQTAAKAVVEAATAAWKRKFTSSKVDDCTAVCLFLQTRK
ncbi:PROTEIN PHOSPHATASE 2C 72-RELATED [Salix purpurea]|uniref:PROTEIN PHOSPHATASE 2C 72-RELATED n=1 Tax=Salix purpurea TaxID=77065 RepID=A0A9Q0T2J1_SALPP|nr:PROTEIN PHOSPHATASE 2C 72-RELATED [Salix purpurea]